MEKPSTQILLKALRTNLKLAIDNGVSSGPELIASFFQTLVMSEGERWIWKTVESVTLALRSIPSEGQPVAAAEAAVRSFATRELGKADLIASLEDYIANATADLLMFAAWNAASGSVGGDPIPVRVWTLDFQLSQDFRLKLIYQTYCFARDDRVYLHFVQRCQHHKTAINRKCTKRLKWQLRVLEEGLKGRNVMFRVRVSAIRRSRIILTHFC